MMPTTVNNTRPAITPPTIAATLLDEPSPSSAGSLDSVFLSPGKEQNKLINKEIVKISRIKIIVSELVNIVAQILVRIDIFSLPICPPWKTFSRKYLGIFNCVFLNVSQFVHP